MLNLFFPFLNIGSQPKPRAVDSPAPETRGEPERNDPERSNELASAAPVQQPEASRRENGSSRNARAKKAADHTGTGKAVAGGRRTKRPKEAEASGSTRPEAEKAHEDPVLIETARPEKPMRVKPGGRAGKWSTTLHGDAASASSLPAGQRWKRRLPRASW
jgi:hypothetical protein